MKEIIKERYRKQLRRILDKMTRILITGCNTLRECRSINELNLVNTDFHGRFEMIFEMCIKNVCI